MKIVVASKNPVKIEAVKAAFKKVFPGKKLEFESVDVISGVSDQPIGRMETIKGAMNRAENASKKVKADFYVGLEGGVNKTMDVETAWMIVRDSKGRIGKSSTSSFELPQEIVKLLKEGKELAEACGRVFGTTNSKHTAGAVGLLTHGVVDRKKYYTQALILALIPFKNKKLYFV